MLDPKKTRGRSHGGIGANSLQLLKKQLKMHGIKPVGDDRNLSIPRSDLFI